MLRRKLLVFPAFVVLFFGFWGCSCAPLTKAPKEATVYALVWLGEPGRLPSGEGKDRAEVHASRQRIFHDDVNVLEPALEDPAVAMFRSFGRDVAWLKKNLRVERVGEPEALRPLLARDQAVVRVWIAQGTPEEQAAWINAVVRAWDTKFFARRRQVGKVNQAVERLKNWEKRESESIQRDEAYLARLNLLPIPADPLEKKSLEGQKKRYEDEIRASQAAIRAIPGRIEEAYAAQRRIPIILEWAKALEPAEATSPSRGHFLTSPRRQQGEPRR
jgi:hypothetical protein